MLLRAASADNCCFGRSCFPGSPYKLRASASDGIAQGVLAVPSVLAALVTAAPAGEALLHKQCQSNQHLRITSRLQPCHAIRRCNCSRYCQANESLSLHFHKLLAMDYVGKTSQPTPPLYSTPMLSICCLCRWMGAMAVWLVRCCSGHPGDHFFSVSVA